MGSNNNDGSSHGRCSKKQKQKRRVPQRGLGVAQLERIRLEEQHHHHQKKYHHHVHGGLSSTSSAGFTAATMLTSSSSISNGQSSKFSTFHHQSPHKISRHGSHSLHTSFHRYRKSSNYDCSVGGGSVDQKDMASCSAEGIFPFWGRSSSSGGSSLRTESNPNHNLNPIRPVQRAHHHQQYYESMMNHATNSSSSSSTVINFHQMELPSNQSFYSNLSGYGGWAAEEEEKTIGMKRAHPLSQQQDSTSVNGGGSGGGSLALSPPPPSFMYQSNSSSVNKQQYPSVVHHHHHHESPSSFNFGSGPVFNFSSSNPPYFRDGSLGWNVTWQPESRRAIRDDNGGTIATTFPAQFLTLAPPAVTPTAAGRQVLDSSLMLNHPHFHRCTSTNKMLELDPSSQSHSHSHHHHHHHHQGGETEDEAASDHQQQGVRHAGSLFLPHKFMQDETTEEHVDLNLKL